MRRDWTLSIFMTAALLLLPSAAGQVSHEDYDKAEMETAAIRFYVLSTLNELNLTLEAALEDDLNSTMEHQQLFSKRIGDISETLDRIPQDVDSYPVLLDYRDTLIFTGQNLTGLVTNFSDVLYSIGTFDDMDLHSWNSTVMSQQLLDLDEAFMRFGPSVDEMRSFAGMLYRDLSSIELFGFDVDHQRSLLDELDVHIGELASNATSPEVAGPLLMEGLVPHWDRSLGRLASETDPGTILGRKTAFLSTISPRLRSDLGEVAGTIGRRMYNVHQGCTDLRENQTGFLSSMDDLEMGRGLIKDQLSLYSEAGGHLRDMEEELSFQREMSIWCASFESGSVEGNISLLDGLITSYRIRFEDFSPLLFQMKELSRLVSGVMRLNVLYNSSWDTNLSLADIQGIRLPEDVPANTSRMVELNRELGSQIDMVENNWYDDMTDLYIPLNRSVVQTDAFTDSHTHFLILLRSLEQTQIRAGPVDPASIVREAIDEVQNMYNRLDLMEELAGMVNSSEIGMDISPIPLLRSQLDLYMVSLENLTITYNISGLFLSAFDEAFPYDGELQISVMFIQKDDHDRIGFPTGKNIIILIDDRTILNLTTVDGRASGKVTVQRMWSLGEHRIGALYNGTLWSNSSFSVRKIRTSLNMEVSKRVLEPGESTTVSLIAHDEFGRRLRGNISIGDVLFSVVGDVSRDISFDRAGERMIPAVYDGDEWTGPSSASVKLNISHPPIVILDVLNTTVYQDRWINGSVQLVRGQGRNLLTADNETVDLGTLKQGEFRNFSIEAELLGPGLHSLQVTHFTDVNWSRDGYSDLLWVLIEKRPEPDKPDEDDDDDPVDDDDDDDPVDDDDDDPVDDEGRYEEALRIVALILVIITVVVIILLFLIRRKRTGNRLELIVPRRKRTTTKVIALEQEDEERPRGYIPRDPDPRKKRARIVEKKSDPMRDAVITSYLEVIDRSPEGLGLKRSNTPREVWSILSRSGMDRDTIASLVTNFEDALYKEGSPSKERVRNVKASAANILAAFSTSGPSAT
ncbi:MAG: hypothetical protein R6V01_08860 [Thermoplasmatota archaeon]